MHLTKYYINFTRMQGNVDSVLMVHISSGSFGEIPAQFYPYCNEYESCGPLECVMSGQ